MHLPPRKHLALGLHPVPSASPPDCVNNQPPPGLTTHNIRMRTALLAPLGPTSSHISPEGWRHQEVPVAVCLSYMSSINNRLLLSPPRPRLDSASRMLILPLLIDRVQVFTPKITSFGFLEDLEEGLETRPASARIMSASEERVVQLRQSHTANRGDFMNAQAATSPIIPF